MKIIHLDDIIGAINPMRYKGYYYDSETKYYWLNSRFYVPSWRRFLSPDKLGNLNFQKLDRFNLFVYVNCCPTSIRYVTSNGDVKSTQSNTFTLENKLDNIGFEILTLNYGILLQNLSDSFDKFDMLSSYLTGTISGVLSYIGSPQLASISSKLEKFSTWTLILGIFIHILYSAYTNLTDPNLNKKQQWLGFYFDVIGILTKTVFTFGLTKSLTSVATFLGTTIGGIMITYLGASLLTGILVGMIATGAIYVGGLILIGLLMRLFDKYWKKLKERMMENIK